MELFPILLAWLGFDDGDPENPYCEDDSCPIL